MDVKSFLKKIVPPVVIDLYRFVKKNLVDRRGTHPECRTSDISGFAVRIPYHSAIDRLIRDLPLYSRNMSRVAVFVQTHFPRTAMIDVGANIGDTVALVRAVSDIQMLCIEGEKNFIDCLEDNIKQFRGVETLHCFLGEKDSISSFKKAGTDTTLTLETSESGAMEIRTLDTCLRDKKEFIDSKVLKIDTDGFEMKILRGASSYILRSRPVLFVEYSPLHYKLAGETPSDLFALLASYGYKDILIYDHKGLLLMHGSLDNIPQLFVVSEYICQRETSIPYFDLAVFHESDQEMCCAFLREERQFYRQFDVLLTRETDVGAAGG